MSVPALTRGAATDRRAWLRLAVVVLLVLIYGSLWLAYTANGLVAFGRFQQLAPGASGTVDGLTYTVKSMTVTRTLVSDGGASRAAAEPNTVWVVAELEVQRTPAAGDEFYCSVNLLGPERRTWETATNPVSRKINGYCSADDVTLGQPYAYETIFSVPARYADQIYGIVLTDTSSSDPDLVIRPPA